MTYWVVVEKIFLKKHTASWTNTHDDVTVLQIMEWLKIQKPEYFEQKTQFFYEIEKFLSFVSDDKFKEVIVL